VTTEGQTIFLLELVTAGVSLGAVYALVAHGYNITFRTVRVVNFGHGSFLMMAVMVTLALVNAGLPLWAAILAGLSLSAFMGWLLEVVAVRPVVRARTGMGWVVSTLGAGIVLQAIATEVWGTQTKAFPAVVFESTDYVRFLGVQLSAQLLLAFAAALSVMVVFEAFIRFTLLGRAMMATAADAECARTMGINTRRMTSLAFALSGVLAGLAGILIAPLTGIDPAFGLELMVKGFVAAVVGGMGSSAGALVGGIFVGLLELLVGGYISSAARNGVVFSVLILVLAVRPQGLLGRQPMAKV
jgi:branched-chain amino acid transport system permease protein